MHELIEMSRIVVQYTTPSGIGMAVASIATKFGVSESYRPLATVG
jgi:hypothetical protein